MALFVVRHQHPAERCPAKDPSMGAMLLNHLTEANAQQHGVRIHGDAVVDGQHTLYLILEAGDQATVDQYMAPFRMAGTVEIMPSSSCQEVVARRGCA
jgi:hypothetical protein